MPQVDASTGMMITRAMGGSDEFVDTASLPALSARSTTNRWGTATVRIHK
jgi:hypothetical protein